MTRGMIAFFGNFGSHNLGNECTLQAVLDNTSRRLPGVRVSCICSDPEDVAARHRIPAIPIYRPGRHRSSVSTHVVWRVLRRVFVGLPQELLHWVTAFWALKGTAMLIMTGTGMLGDFGITPGDLHYEILKWSLAAKVQGCSVVFLSVGASRLDHPVSRWLVKRSLALADYRSFRDPFSRDYLASIGAPTKDDPVYPDLAFSLAPATLADLPDGSTSGRVVGVGLMDYYGKQSRPEVGEHKYQAYLQTMTAFTAWLLRQQYTVRLIVGDLSYDTRVKADLIAALRRDGVVYDRRQLVDEPVATVGELLKQLASSDVVVATRFHNVLLSLLLDKPVVSVSYDQKNDAVMAQAGLLAYCQPIDRLNVERLIDQFVRLEADRDAVKTDLLRRTAQQRRQLEEQYRAIFGAPPGPAPEPTRYAASAITRADLRC